MPIRTGLALQEKKKMKWELESQHPRAAWRHYFPQSFSAEQRQLGSFACRGRYKSLLIWRLGQQIPASSVNATSSLFLLLSLSCLVQLWCSCFSGNMALWSTKVLVFLSLLAPLSADMLIDQGVDRFSRLLITTNWTDFKIIFICTPVEKTCTVGGVYREKWDFSALCCHKAIE